MTSKHIKISHTGNFQSKCTISWTVHINILNFIFKKIIKINYLTIYIWVFKKDLLDLANIWNWIILYVRLQNSYFSIINVLIQSMNAVYSLYFTVRLITISNQNILQFGNCFISQFSYFTDFELFSEVSLLVEVVVWTCLTTRPLDRILMMLQMIVLQILNQKQNLKYTMIDVKSYYCNWLTIKKSNLDGHHQTHSIHNQNWFGNIKMSARVNYAEIMRLFGL